MGSPYDPYKPPSASLEERPHGESITVPLSVIQPLAQTRPWVKLLAVLIFIGLSLGLIIGAGAFVFGGLSPVRSATIIPMVLVLALYAPPAVFMWRYADTILRLQEGGGQAALEQALSHQKSFWKYMGIVAIVMLCLYVVIFIVGVVGGGLLRM
jgi:hypothetical protein